MASVYDEMPSPAAGVIRLARSKAGITQAELARRAEVPASMISAYERDRRQPTLATLLRLLKAAGYDLRMHLAPYDDHDDVLAEQRRQWPQADQDAWEAYQRARIDAGRPAVKALRQRRRLRPPEPPSSMAEPPDAKWDGSMAEPPDAKWDGGEVAEPAHAGEQLKALRLAAGMTVAEVAERAGVDVDWLRRLEDGERTHDVLYSQWTSLVRATQPPRPEWWDEGHEHDLSLPLDGHREPTTDSGRRYWAGVAAVAAQIEEHYGRGRTA